MTKRLGIKALKALPGIAGGRVVDEEQKAGAESDAYKFTLEVKVKFGKKCPLSDAQQYVLEQEVSPTLAEFLRLKLNGGPVETDKLFIRGGMVRVKDPALFDLRPPAPKQEKLPE